MLFQTKAANLANTKARRSFMPNGALAGIGLIPAIAAHTMINQNLFHHSGFSLKFASYTGRASSVSAPEAAQPVLLRPKRDLLTLLPLLA
jgi:hypothetical protein